MSKTILVTAATGKIGKYLVPDLIKKNYTVHALVRSLDSPASLELEAMGTKLFKGDFDDLDAIRAASKGIDGVLINTVPTYGSMKEVDQIRNIIQGAKEGGATTAVYISAYLLDQKDNFPGYGPKHPMYHMSECKAQAEADLKEAGFQSWTVLRPPSFMDNQFMPQIYELQWPHLHTEHTLVTTLPTTFKFPLIDPLTIAEYAEAAFADPELLKSQIIELASDTPTLDEMAAKMTRVIGQEFKAKCVPKEEAASVGIFAVLPLWWDALQMFEHTIDLKSLQTYPIKLHTFGDYLERNKDWIVPQFEDKKDEN
ncbi:hypothetical protein K450DRAFT_269273 [Umbelopsis ramanniana AG]|uniref:NmrA-like domain-containing protein n=1 Tax=Umbelopsis ramanniana AG TaxID=1314678 RepID=A0AAD5HHC3_UMBRA|nr:uncharacterized protein K450DRAFT_269273 [Umbelopsis ramanniana AG]KAI8582526.1 hypothetical protein K450DRAFT_269273 [Umbelopsis ramanniana AG]